MPRIVKYIRRVPKPSGKGYYYFYNKADYQKYLKTGDAGQQAGHGTFFDAIKSFFGIQSDKKISATVKEEYAKHDIKGKFGLSIFEFTDHLAEYFTNREKWDTYFSKKKVEKVAKKKNQFSKKDMKKKVKSGGKSFALSVMRFIFETYEGGQNGKDKNRTRSGTISGNKQAVHGNGDSGRAYPNVPEKQPTADSRTPILSGGNSGERSGDDVQLIRIGKKTASKIRQMCHDLLKSKTDEEMTDEDKALLRQYEGAGGLGEEGQDSLQTLTAFYTPQKIVKKIWELTNKYVGHKGKLDVLEPSAATGRFMDDHPHHNYDAIEIDPTSARINKILHPNANVKEGAFQSMFFDKATGRVHQKNYTGKKYDVIIGNPPYTEYSGHYKTWGEGKDHDRYEEYFIERGLDTLKDGGIMSFIVPSSFLRSGDNGKKIKELIASKGRLLEAWRLPNGTFSSTGVGTDVIIIRKEKGNAEDFTNDNFFSKNPDNILGEEVLKRNQYGDMEKYMQTKSGQTFDDAINSIDVTRHDVPKMGEKTLSEEHKENIGVGLRGNKNAKKDIKAEPKKGESVIRKKNETQTLEEFNATYNRKFKPHELEVWKATQFDGAIEFDNLSAKTRKSFEESGDLCKANGKIYHKLNYASGNIYNKLKDLETDKLHGRLTESEYARQKGYLEKAIPERKTVKNITVSPLTMFAREFMFHDEDGTESGSLLNRFWYWAGVRPDRKRWQDFEGGVTKKDIPINATWTDIVEYIEGDSVRKESGSGDEGALKADKCREQRRDAAEAIFKRFIEQGLTPQEREELESRWNRTYNANVDPDYTKIPLHVEGISKTFKGKKLEVKDIQLKGAAFVGNKGNGLLAYDVGVGKAQPLDAKILTPSGWVRMGDIHIGDEVMTPDGLTAKVIGVYPQGEKEIFKVTFSDGSKTECCEEHLWTVSLPWGRNKAQSKGKERFSVKPLYSIMDDLRNSRGERKYSIPMIVPIDLKERDLLIHPYLMGVLLGDGCFSQKSTMISSMDNEIIEFIRKNCLPDDVQIVKKNGTNCDYSIVSKYETRTCSITRKFLPCNSIHQNLKKYGLFGKKSDQKFIPDDYKIGSLWDRIQILRGLMDSDGFVNASGTTTQFTTTSINLANDVIDIIMSLGGTAKTASRNPSYTYQGEKKTGKNAYTLTIVLPESINPFHLERKHIRVKGKSKYKPVRYIDSVEYIGKKQAQCIMVDHRDHLYITDDYIVTHNTLTGILATVQQLQTGRAKAPAICVPTGVYKNWIAEIRELFPDIKINELGNLGKDYAHKVPKTADGKFDLSGGLTVMSYEALKNITFKDETINGQLATDMEQSQLLGSGEKKSKRAAALESEKIDAKVGTATKVKSEAFFFEDLGIDHITFDEIHNFKNIFAAAKAPERTDSRGRSIQSSNEFSDIKGGSSNQGIKAFAIAQYIQANNHGRNVFGLSATPFTNSPLEIYNILSLLARSRLKELGIYNIHEFMAQFAKLKNEWTVSTKGTIERKSVMKDFQNLSALQSLIKEYIDKVDGEEAGVVRPDKTTHLMNLPMTPLQELLMQAEQGRMADKSRDNPAAAIVGINNTRMSTVSPLLVEMDKYHEEIPEIAELMAEARKQGFVKSSPKLQFEFDSTVEIHKARPDLGQVIYMPVGNKYFKDCVQYLVDKGMSRDSIAIIEGSTSTKKREQIMADFNNPDGKIKVIIGSEAIQEGVNLNGNTAVIHNTMLGWNPSETTQVEGRIWRQGNKQKKVHVCYPQIVNSIDASMYQKHDEKRSRFNALWSYKGDSLNVEDINPEELKFDLIKDPQRRARFKIDLEKERLESSVRDFEISIESLEKMKSDHIRSSENVSYYTEKAQSYSDNAAKYKERIDIIKKKPEEDRSWDEKRELSSLEYSYEHLKKDAETYKKDLKKIQGKIAGIENTLKQMGNITVSTVDEEVANRKAEKERIEEEIKSIKEKFDDYVEAEKRKLMEEKSQKTPSVDESVKVFVQNVLSNLSQEEKEELKKAFAKRGTLIVVKRLNDETGLFEYSRVRC